jgi:hypothetical protein
VYIRRSDEDRSGGVVYDRGGRLISPNTLTDRVPKGCIEGFCHFWHLITLGFEETYDHVLNIGEAALEGRTSRNDTLAKCPGESRHSDPRRSRTNRFRCGVLFRRRTQTKFLDP